MMENVNVIKQGYLKKGNSVEGPGRGMFSGFIEKITPRKWYMLVVRNRVPLLEQYERDVDVFSSKPSVSYDLSVCTSISRTMSMTARTFNFVIVCPEELIELIAASRAQMVDWCNTLERTLSTLGILRKEKEEHVYTFCPAVVNTVGKSQNKEEGEDEGDSEDELGAVGGAPAPTLPPPPRSQPPPIPSTAHPAPLPRMLSEPAGSTSPSPARTPPPVTPRGQGRRSASPLETVSGSIVNSAPPSPHVSIPLPPAADRSSPVPPPLPRGRFAGAAAAAEDRPPPLPPGRPQALVSGTVPERSLPPLPPRPNADADRPAKPSGGSSSEEEEEEEDSSDYSSDFVSGAFWEINRKTPIPTARHAVLPSKHGVSDSSASSEVSGKAGSGAEKETVELEELDDGYTDISVVRSLRRSDPVDAKSTEYAKVKKRPLTEDAARLASSPEGVESTESSEPSTPLSVDSLELSPSQSRIQCSDSRPPEVMSCSAMSEDEQQPKAGGSDNFYAPFPGESEDSSMTSSKHSENWSEEDTGAQVSVVKITSATPHDRSPADLPPLPDGDSELDCMYASAAEASTLFPSDNIPPLPPRQDSLSTWTGESSGEASSNHMTVTAPSSAADPQTPPPTETAKHRPIPRRRTIHPMSHPVTRAEQEERESPSPGIRSEIPPLPPPRRGVPTGQSMDSISHPAPPPLPARKTQSVRGQRPMSLIASTYSAVEPEVELPTSMSESFSGSTALSRQQSFSNGDTSGAENHLRQRQRLDRVHSINSVISLKQSQVEMLVKRTPHAKVLAIRRLAEGQSIGIKRNGGTAEILYVDPNGLAAGNGLPLHAPGVLRDQGRSNWVLTEINSRHLNLFFKDNEIEHRLNAVGREITIVVQPADYITELKKQLKKMKNYKNYIVQ